MLKYIIIYFFFIKSLDETAFTIIIYRKSFEKNQILPKLFTKALAICDQIFIKLKTCGARRLVGPI